MRAALALLLAIPTAAAASPTLPTAAPDLPGPPPELALGDAALDLPPLRDLARELADAPDDDLPDAAAVGYAQLIAGTTGVGLGVGGGVEVTGVGCNFVTATAQALLHTDAEAPAAALARWDVCFNLFPFIRYSGDVGLGLAPPIDARRSLWRRAYDEHYQRVEVGLGPLPFSAEHVDNLYSFFHVALGWAYLNQSDGERARHVVGLDVDLALLGFHRVKSGSEIDVDAVVLTNDALKAGDSDLGAVTSAFYPARVRVDVGHFFASARAGWEQSGGVVTDSGSTYVNGKETSSWSETVDATGLPVFTMTAGEATAGVRFSRITASASIARGMFPTFDGNLAAEARASADVAIALGHRHDTRLSISPFVARTRTFSREAPEQYDLASGAQVQFGRQLTRLLHLDAIGQAGKTPYARLDGDRAPATALGGQVMVALSATARRAGRVRLP